MGARLRDGGRARCPRACGADLGLRRVCALIVPDNVRSRRVAERLGMAVDREVEWAGLPHDLWVCLMAEIGRGASARRRRRPVLP